MSYLELLRVFPLEFDTVGLAFWSWDRWIMLVALILISVPCIYGLGSWFAVVTALAKMTSRKPVDQQALGRFLNVEFNVIVVFAALAGAIYWVAGAFFPDTVLFYRDHGIQSFAELDLGGWTMFAAVALMGWLGLQLIVVNAAHFGPVLGTLHVIPQAFYAGVIFLFGVLLGPIVFLMLFQPMHLRSGAAWQNLHAFLLWPFQLLFTSRRPTFSTGGLFSLSKAVQRATRY